MDNETNLNNPIENTENISDVVYNTDKDFYKGIKGELRLKAEGLFKKAKEKGISIEDIEINVLKETFVEFPGIGDVYLPAYIITIKGKDIKTEQVIVDGKHIDYFNRYQKYICDKIYDKNILRDQSGRIIRNRYEAAPKRDLDLNLTDWEKFQIGKSIVEDKEFGLEKTITGACDRVIRKLMGENDWLYPDEAKLLDEEYSAVQSSIMESQENKKKEQAVPPKRATDKQINYLKSRIKNSGIDPENENVIKEVIKQSGINASAVNEMTTLEMSKVIDNLNNIIPKVKVFLEKENFSTNEEELQH